MGYLNSKDDEYVTIKINDVTYYFFKEDGEILDEFIYRRALAKQIDDE